MAVSPLDEYSAPEGAIQPATRKNYWSRLLMIRRLELACALALTILILFLHVYRARYGGGLWRDEVTTLASATSPSLPDVWSSQIYARPPLLPYVAVRIWTGIHSLGSGDTSLRVLGALTGIGVLAVLWLNKRALGYRVPILSLVFFGLLPNVIQWGDSIRGYGLGCIFILLAYGCVWKVVESPTPGRVVLATLVSILSVQCLFQNAPLLLAICLGAFIVCLRNKSWKTMIAVFAIGTISALSLAPYWRMIMKYDELNLVLQDQQSSDFAQQLKWLALALSSNNALLVWTFVIGCGCSILAAGYLVTAKRKDEGCQGRVDLAIFSVTILVIGLVAFIVFSMEAKLYVFAWRWLPLMALMALAMEVLIELIATTITVTMGRLVLALAVASLVIPMAWELAAVRQTNVDLIASMLRERASPGDLIIINPWYLGITFQHYYRGQASWVTVPPIQPSSFPQYDLWTEQIARKNPLQPVFDAIVNSLKTGNRVWLVGQTGLPPLGEPPPELPSKAKGLGPYVVRVQNPDKSTAAIDCGGFLDYADYILTLQLGYFMRSHVLGAEVENLGISQPVNPLELIGLRVFWGWRP